MSASTYAIHGNAVVLGLPGEVGVEQLPGLDRVVGSAHRVAGRRVLIDLTATRHLHYRVAEMFVGHAADGRRVGVVGADPYVRQILLLAGARDGEPREYPSLGEALEDAAA